MKLPVDIPKMPCDFILTHSEIGKEILTSARMRLHWEKQKCKYPTFFASHYIQKRPPGSLTVLGMCQTGIPVGKSRLGQASGLPNDPTGSCPQIPPRGFIPRGALVGQGFSARPDPPEDAR